MITLHLNEHEVLIKKDLSLEFSLPLRQAIFFFNLDHDQIEDLECGFDISIDYPITAELTPAPKSSVSSLSLNNENSDALIYMMDECLADYYSLDGGKVYKPNTRMERARYKKHRREWKQYESENLDASLCLDNNKSNAFICLDNKKAVDPICLDNKKAKAPRRLDNKKSKDPRCLDNKKADDPRCLDNKKSKAPRRLDNKKSKDPRCLDNKKADDPRCLDNKKSKAPRRLDNKKSKDPRCLDNKNLDALIRLENVSLDDYYSVKTYKNRYPGSIENDKYQKHLREWEKYSN